MARPKKNKENTDQKEIKTVKVKAKNRSTLKQEFIKAVKRGQPTKYNPEKHIGLLFDVFSKGEDIAAFCAEALITKITFFSWIKNNKDFKFAYDIARNIACRIWEQYPLIKPNFNYQHWFTVMKNRFDLGKVVIRDEIRNTDSVTIKLDKIWQALGSGELNIHDANKLVALVNAEINIHSNQKLDSINNEQSKTKEELHSKLSTLRLAIDYIEKQNSHQ